MDPHKKLHIRINYENTDPTHKPTDAPLSERSHNNPKHRPNNAKTHAHLFHKRNNTAVTDLTQLVRQYEPMSSTDVRQQLQKKEKYLQSLIEEIVESEEAHKREMSSIEQRYEAEIQKMHQELQNLVQKNRLLRCHVGQQVQREQVRQKRSPRISNETLLLESDQISSFDFE